MPAPAHAPSAVLDLVVHPGSREESVGPLYGGALKVSVREPPDKGKANRAVIDLLERIAIEKAATPAQIALAWLLAQKPWIVPIPGSRKLERLDENIGAGAIELTPDDLSDIEDAMSKITVVGDRY